MDKSNVHYLIGDQGKKIFTQSWAVEKPKAVVLIAHGFAEHSGRYAHVAKYFNSIGMSAMAIDHYGHGQTEGLKGHVDRYDLFLDSMQQFLDAANNQFPGAPKILYGHSMGGNIVLNFLFKRKPTVAGVIVTGPWIDVLAETPKIKILIGKALRNILPKMRQETELQEKLLSSDQSVGIAYVADPLVQTKISNAMGIDMLLASDYLRDYTGEAKVPILLMHGKADQIIDPNATPKLADRLSGPVTLKMWDNLYHEIHNEFEKEKVFAFIGDWIAKELNIHNS